LTGFILVRFYDQAMDVADRSRARVEERLTRLESKFDAPTVTQTTFEVDEERYQRAVEESRGGQLDVRTVVRDDDADVLFTAVDGTRTLETRRTGTYPTVVRNDNVVVVTDASFVEPSELYDADNEVFAGNLIDFLAGGDRGGGSFDSGDSTTESGSTATETNSTDSGSNSTTSLAPQPGR